MKTEFIASPTRSVRILQHVIFWILVITFFTVMIGAQSGQYFQVTLELFFTLPLDIAVTYFHLYYLIPRILIRKKYFLMLIMLLVTAFVILVIESFVNRHIVMPIFWPDVDMKSFPLLSWKSFYLLVNIYCIVLFASVLKLIRYWMKTDQERMNLELQNKASELALLRSQISPHFLFNTLNNIDTLINIDSAKASDCVHRLSEIMRYIIYETDRDYVILQKEINYLKTFIELQSIRYKDRNFVDFHIEGEANSQLIAPMVLVPFVENAFKHVDKTAGMPAIRIRIDIFKGSLEMSVMNNFRAVEDGTKDDASGIGLSNVIRRLKLLYPDHYDLNIQTDNSIFSVHLRINLQ